MSTGSSKAGEASGAREKLRKLLAGASVVLALVGAGMLAYPFASDLWAQMLQGRLAGELEVARGTRVATGDALTRLQIPKLGVDIIVVEGTTQAALRAGAGHYPETALPGEKGNVAIAGHRTTYGRPFNRLDALAPGDRIVLSTPLGRYVYRVATEPRVIRPDDWSPIFGYPRRASLLTLTTCHPEGSADFRLVVRARLHAAGAKRA